MYQRIPDATEEIIYGFKCQIPPIGYGVHSITSKLVKTDIIKRSSSPTEQYWERTKLPIDWVKKRKSESIKQKEDEDYFDSSLESFRVQEWNRRLAGVWVYIKGVPTYLTGLHYFYINWWSIDIGYPDYRNSDRKFYYVLQYCMEDPKCLGLIEGAKRRQGKTYRGGCFLYEEISRVKESEGGIQSKTATDARDVVFKKAVVSPFKKLPDFFRPIFDMSKGVTPTSELKFAHTVKKGKAALDDLEKPELNSLIDWTSAEVFGYDGRKKRRIFEDEIGKSIGVDVYERHQVVRYCLETDGVFTGFKLGSTTVEEMTSGGAEFKKLWLESDPKNVDKNGHTQTGMYRYMTPAYETLYYDKYGMPDEAKATEYFLNRRAGLANNPHALSGEIRKNPFNEMEMFRIDGDKCIYNPEILNNQLDLLTWGTNYTTIGDFIWKDGLRDTSVEWVPNKKGAFEITCLPPEDQRNKVIKRGNLFYPNNKLNYTAGGDPYDYDKTVDKRRSNGTGFVKWKFNSFDASNVYNDSLTIMYSNRPQTASLYYEEMIKMCFFCGCEFLAERNKIGLIRYFEQRGYGAFLIRFPGEVEPGIYAGTQTRQEMVEITEEFIIKNGHKIFFKSLLQQWLKFDLKDTEKFDEAMGAGWTLVGDKRRIIKQDSETPVNYSDLFQKFKVNA